MEIEIGAILIGFVGMLFVVPGFFMMRAFKKGNRTGQDVEATVLSKRRTGSSKHGYYYATVQYQIGGQTYTTEISGQTIMLPDVGETLTIGVDPQKPEEVSLRRGKSVYIVMYVIGAFFFAIGLYFQFA